MYGVLGSIYLWGGQDFFGWFKAGGVTEKSKSLNSFLQIFYLTRGGTIRDCAQSSMSKIKGNILLSL